MAEILALLLATSWALVLGFWFGWALRGRRG